MTLADMRPEDMGVILAAPATLTRILPCLCERVRLITVSGDLVLIDLGGMRVALSLAVARQIILTAYYE
ncbi:MAG: hypothetical protein IKB41_01510 [Clostridia bacterium]|nr:hypothetical protein [Clostridia bacterium]